MCALQEFLVKYVQHLFDVLQHLRITAHLDIGPDTAGGQPAAGTDCTKNQPVLLAIHLTRHIRIALRDAKAGTPDRLLGEHKCTRSTIGPTSKAPFNCSKLYATTFVSFSFRFVGF